MASVRFFFFLLRGAPRTQPKAAKPGSAFAWKTFYFMNIFIL
jgi:hypothetical protein